MRLIGIYLILVGIFSALSALAADTTFKCAKGGTTAAITYYGFGAIYNIETRTGNDRNGDYSGHTRTLNNVKMSKDDLGTVITGDYTDASFGINSYKYDFKATIYKDPSAGSRIIVTRSYYNEAKGYVKDEPYEDLAGLPCAIVPPRN